MGARNSTLSGSSVNTTNFVRLFLVIQENVTKVLQELLLLTKQHTSLDSDIRKNMYLNSTLKSYEWIVIKTVQTKQYADFDIPLMYKIIRNLKLVPAPTQGWDNLNPPTSTEITIGDDIERIRRYRNYIMHSGNTNISDVELGNVFSLFIDIARRLEVYLKKTNREYVTAIENAKTCCLDPEKEQMYLRQLEDLVERETTNVSAVNHSVDELRRQNQMTKEIDEWKIKDNKFVPTRASAYVSNILNKESSVTLTGSPGVGKTFLARHIALNFQSKGYTIIIVLTPTDIREYIHPEKKMFLL